MLSRSEKMRKLPLSGLGSSKVFFTLSSSSMFFYNYHLCEVSSFVSSFVFVFVLADVLCFL